MEILARRRVAYVGEPLMWEVGGYRTQHDLTVSEWQACVGMCCQDPNLPALTSPLEVVSLVAMDQLRKFCYIATQLGGFST